MLSQPVLSHATLSKPILATKSPCKKAEIVTMVLLFVISVKLCCNPSDANQFAVSGSLSAKPGEPPSASLALNTSVAPAPTTLTPDGCAINVLLCTAELPE